MPSPPPGGDDDDPFDASAELGFLDQLEDQAAAKAPAAPPPPAFSLVSLDGEETEMPAPSIGPAVAPAAAPPPVPPAAAPPPAPPAAVPPPAPPVAPRAAPPPVPTAAAAAPEADRFAPPPERTSELALDRPRPAPAPPPEEPLPFAARCEAHDLPEPCAACAEEERPIPGRLFQGALRRQPLGRLAAGIVLGLAVGWLASWPYARRAEKRVAQLRAAADLERHRPSEESRAETARLDAEADRQAERAAWTTGAIWLLVGGAALGGWYRLT